MTIHTKNPKSLSLYELNNLVRSTFDTVLYDEYWLKAEIGEVHQNRGHCFLEFVQKDESSNALIAKARGQIWANKWAVLRPYFEKTTKRSFSSGIQVLVCVELTFHEVYGYSLNVIDIDPIYTIGDIARKRQEIIQHLENAGVLRMNKDLSLPRLLKRVAVISSATAAGYGDFIKQIENNSSGLKFIVKLFPSTMQGDGVEKSVINALDAIAEEMEHWDVVVIIRGGGASSDLYGFDTLSLAENVAQFPLPVISGIGHERDDTVVDVVAHTRVKTPTAAAEFIIRHQEAELQRLQNIKETLTRGCSMLMNNEKIKLERIGNKIPMLWDFIKTKELRHLDESVMRIQNLTESSLAAMKMKLDFTYQRLRFTSRAYVEKQKHELEIKERQIELSSPERLLKLGYSITRINGKAISTIHSLMPGDVLETMFADGEIQSIVKGLSEKGLSKNNINNNKNKSN